MNNNLFNSHRCISVNVNITAIIIIIMTTVNNVSKIIIINIING